jgi:hypothetical protein
MSKVKYLIVNGDNVLGMFYETEHLGNVFVMQEKVNFNFPLEIYTRQESGFEKVSEIDIVTDFMEILQYNLKKEGLE